MFQLLVSMQKWRLFSSNNVRGGSRSTWWADLLIMTSYCYVIYLIISLYHHYMKLDYCVFYTRSSFLEMVSFLSHSKNLRIVPPSHLQVNEDDGIRTKKVFFTYTLLCWLMEEILVIEDSIYLNMTIPHWSELFCWLVSFALLWISIEAP